MFPPLRVEETVLTRFYGRVQAPVNEETLFFAETKCFRRKSETFFVSRKQNMFLQQMFLSRANEETLRETCFLNNVSPFAAALSCIY